MLMILGTGAGFFMMVTDADAVETNCGPAGLELTEIQGLSPCRTKGRGSSHIMLFSSLRVLDFHQYESIKNLS